MAVDGSHIHTETTDPTDRT